MSTKSDDSHDDLEIICRAIAEGRKLDPKFIERVRQRSRSHRRKFDHEVSVEWLRDARDNDE